MRIRTYVIAVILFMALCSGLGAQITGTVVDAESGIGLAGVEVIEVNSGFSTLCDKDGIYDLDMVVAEPLQLILFKEGYQLKEVIIDSNTEEYDFQLLRLSVELSEVELVRQRKEIFAIRKLKNVEGTAIYAGKKSEVIVMNLVNGNLAANVSRQIYSQISGLNIYEGSDGGLQLNIGGRGLDPNRTSNFNTRQNGYDISADVLGYPENYYTPPAEALQEIKILRGASSLQYGTQFGGMIDFRIRKLPRYRKLELRSRQTYGSFDFFNSFNSVGYNGKKFSVNAFYNYKQGDGYRDNSGYDAHNAFISSSLFLSAKTQLDVEFTYFEYLAKQAGGLTDEQFDVTPRLSTRERNWFSVDWKLYNVKLHHQFSADRRLEINLFGLDARRSSVGYRGDPVALNENPITALDEVDASGNYLNPRDLIIGKFNNVGAEVKFLTKYLIAGKEGTALVGIKYYNSDNSSIQGPGSKGIDPDFKLQTLDFPDYANQSDFSFPNFNLAAFAENIYYLGDKLTITPGLRFEHIVTKSDGQYNQVVYDLAGNPLSNRIIEETQHFARSFLLTGIGVDYIFSDKLQYSMNLTQNYRSVTFSDIRVTNPSFIIDEDITDERGYSFTAGVKGIVDSRFSYDFNIYSIFYNDRIGIVLDNRANRVRTNIGSAIIAGTESLLQYIPVRIIEKNKKKVELRLFLNTSFTYSQYLNSLSNNVSGNKVEFIPTANIKSGLSFTYENCTLSLQHGCISKQYSDAQNSVRTQDGDFRAGLVGEIPSYQVLDFSLRYSWKKLKLESGINNLLDELYYTRRATGYPGPGIIPSDRRSFFVTLEYLFQS